MKNRSDRLARRHRRRAAAARRTHHRGAGTLCAALLVALFAAPAFAFTVQLTTSLPSPQVVGQAVVLQASVAGADPADIDFRFEARVGGGAWRVLQDFRPRSSFRWVPLDEDVYQLRVVATDFDTGELQAASTGFARVSPGVVSGASLALPTTHPLVALFSVPPCPGGAALRVRYWPAQGGTPGQTTHFKPCRAGKGVNHYVAGMRPGTQYLMRGEIFANGSLVPGPVVAFQTGFPTDLETNFSVIKPGDALSSTSDRVMLASYITGRDDGYFAIATDRAGFPVWTYGRMGSEAGEVAHGMLVRTVPGGTFMVLIGEVDGLRNQYLAEIDLLGNVLRETNVAAVNRRLADLGQDPITSFHHEARPLDNGRTLVLASIERILTDVQGPGDVNVYAEMVVDLDRNFNVKWVWNSFDKLDVTDVAILGEVCSQGQGGCPPLILDDVANDWLHMNSIAYSPGDGNIVVSARHQDAVYKLDYADGTGSGDVVWELGEHGDFTLNAAPGQPWPWFSHAHDAQYYGQFFVIFDNGNTRADALGEGENSRGQVYLLDEDNMEAGLLHNFDLGGYSFGLGSAQRLSNGNYHFNNGALGNFPVDSQYAAQEVTPASTASWVLSGNNATYRSVRMRSLYLQ